MIMPGNLQFSKLVFYLVVIILFFISRMTFERATSLKLPSKKMKTLYKKWIEMEENFGDEKKVESVRQNALLYVNNNK